MKISNCSHVAALCPVSVVLNPRIPTAPPPSRKIRHAHLNVGSQVSVRNLVLAGFLLGKVVKVERLHLK